MFNRECLNNLLNDVLFESVASFEEAVLEAFKIVPERVRLKKMTPTQMKLNDNCDFTYHSIDRGVDLDSYMFFDGIKQTIYVSLWKHSSTKLSLSVELYDSDKCEFTSYPVLREDNFFSTEEEYFQNSLIEEPLFSFEFYTALRNITTEAQRLYIEARSNVQNK